MALGWDADTVGAVVTGVRLAEVERRNDSREQGRSQRVSVSVEGG